MPKDFWARDRNRQTAKRVIAEFEKDCDVHESRWSTSGRQIYDKRLLAEDVNEPDWMACKICKKKLRVVEVDEHMRSEHGRGKSSGHHKWRLSGEESLNLSVAFVRTWTAVELDSCRSLGVAVRFGGQLAELIGILGSEFTIKVGNGLKKLDLLGARVKVGNVEGEVTSVKGTKITIRALSKITTFDLASLPSSKHLIIVRERRS